MSAVRPVCADLQQFGNAVRPSQTGSRLADSRDRHNRPPCIKFLMAALCSRVPRACTHAFCEVRMGDAALGLRILWGPPSSTGRGGLRSATAPMPSATADRLHSSIRRACVHHQGGSPMWTPPAPLAPPRSHSCLCIAHASARPTR